MLAHFQGLCALSRKNFNFSFISQIFFSLIIAVWPVWGFLTIPMIIGMFFGYINTSQFLPGNHIGSVLFALIFVVGLASGYFIEHGGYLH